tara:strand:- start:1238 stop:1360 length:123 start_codon:yes stop_codon:yes gene_type:complete
MNPVPNVEARITLQSLMMDMLIASVATTNTNLQKKTNQDQ